jgi:hypothetical protein
MSRGIAGWVAVLATLGLAASANAQSARKAEKGKKGAPAAPLFKPSKFSKAPVDITTDAYGAFKLAPKAPGIGATLPDFQLPDENGSVWSLKKALHNGPLVLIFYRGDW